MKFRKKPVVIEAIQFTKEMLDGIKPAPACIQFSCMVGDTRVGYIQTLEGTMSVSLGDWIITGVNGEHYACKPDIFEKTYEKVS